MALLSCLALAAALSGCGGGSSSSGSSTDAVASGDLPPGTPAEQLCAEFKTLDAQVTEITSLSNASASKFKQDVADVTDTADQIRTSAQDAKNKNKSILTAAVDSFKTEISGVTDQPISTALVTVGTSLATLKVSVDQVATSLKCS